MSKSVTKQPGGLSDEQMKAIIMALADGSVTFTEADASRVLRWATDTLADYALLSLVLDGRANVSIENGELVFRLPT